VGTGTVKLITAALRNSPKAVALMLIPKGNGRTSLPTLTVTVTVCEPLGVRMTVDWLKTTVGTTPENEPPGLTTPPTRLTVPENPLSPETVAWNVVDAPS
jgi:hypothetical protein